MLSKIVKIAKDDENLQGVLDETKKVSEYAGLDAKKAMRLRLLAEELCGMLREIAGDFDGTFHIENEESSFVLITRIETREMSKKIKRDLINVSSGGQNAAAKGVMGKIRDLVENMLYPENTFYTSEFVSYQLETAALMDDTWTLSAYKNSKRKEDWDELERSIVANLADDVTVSVRGRGVEIIIAKNFVND